MPRFFIENFGCRATDADASAMRRGLAAAGLEQVGDHDSAELIVLNTCTVTAAADAQSREAVRKIRRTNPKGKIIVTGCYAQRAPEELAALDGVSWVVGNSHQGEIPKIAREMFASTAAGGPGFTSVAELRDGEMSLARGAAKILTGDIFAQADLPVTSSADAVADRTRPILKIQDGCNNRCSYCVIPFVRGRSRSMSPDSVIDEVRKYVVVGAREIVLSGINLGSYGRGFSPRVGLSDVVRRILVETDIERLRFSSIEPQDITEEFVALVASSPRIARHFHVPLQSGANRVLRAMHRWYHAELYAERVQLIRRLIPEAAIGADVIVGFPGETKEDFAATVKFIEDMPFTYLHVFSFSPRPGTKAENLVDQVPPAEIRERARALRALSEKKAAAFRASQAGCTVMALTLARKGADWTEAITSNYLKVRVPGTFPP